MENPQKHVYVPVPHHECETLGIIADALKHVAITPKYVRSFEGEAVPKEAATRLASSSCGTRKACMSKTGLHCSATSCALLRMH